LGFLKPGDAVNIERCLSMKGRIDGQIVQGHVDFTATCLQKKTMDGSWEDVCQFSEKFASLVIEKSSICVNAISLTCFNVTKNTFTVAIIPYTYEHTTIGHIQENDSVNIDFDIIGKYLLRLQNLNK
jgi:riboflavin synthase